MRVFAAKNFPCPGMVCHVGKPEDRTSLINATLEKFGGLDVLGE
jgi:hypothetical protein